MCDADYNDYDCCSSHKPCGIGGGDCDIDADCSGSLVCGVDNCQGFDSAWSYSTFDCCMSGKQFAKLDHSKLKRQSMVIGPSTDFCRALGYFMC